jgi:hypothetical protein
MSGCLQQGTMAPLKRHPPCAFTHDCSIIPSVPPYLIPLIPTCLLPPLSILNHAQSSMCCVMCHSLCSVYPKKCTDFTATPNLFDFVSNHHSFNTLQHIKNSAKCHPHLINTLNFSSHASNYYPANKAVNVTNITALVCHMSKEINSAMTANFEDFKLSTTDSGGKWRKKDNRSQEASVIILGEVSFDLQLSWFGNRLKRIMLVRILTVLWYSKLIDGHARQKTRAEGDAEFKEK